MYLGEGLYKVVDVGGLGSLHHLLVRHLPEVGSVADVLGDGGVKEDRLLGHDTHLGPQPADVEVAKVAAVQHHLPLAGVVEPLQERDDGALATPTGTHESERLPRRDGELEAIQNEDIGTSRVPELKIFSLDSSSGIVLWS